MKHSKRKPIEILRTFLKRKKKIITNLIRVGNLYSIRYIEYETNVVGNKTPSMEEYLIKIRPHLKDIMKNLKK